MSRSTARLSGKILKLITVLSKWPPRGRWYWPGYVIKHGKCIGCLQITKNKQKYGLLPRFCSGLRSSGITDGVGWWLATDFWGQHISPFSTVKHSSWTRPLKMGSVDDTETSVTNSQPVQPMPRYNSQQRKKNR